ncbi:MAG: peptide deformylase [Candidatus Liptonbacteria bacterium RIFCSPHIGHO2_01_FULL_57_28]|uniref:Peptide deformylase n=1 Tax=Candidatus Liptonbacteria bacterium RIFCSPHIGHO2_01_FULL_57_28 TaxID=1798647 RepID=A0A1G2CB54_9BACT|nr:MAG: peptide deformylase [Candidatus Liptonbacteria bacterium RIFCSPHIGHO2_01_FULL_57_28]
MNPEIYLIDDASQRDFLARPAGYFDFDAHPRKEVDDLLRRMRRIMREANGIGLSANQIGLPHRLFVTEVPGKDDMKFYAVFNPEIEKMEKDKVIMEEGCLSVPGIYGDVERPARLVLRGQDKRGKPLKIKAWGLLARVFQHEVDHLNGKLFLEKAKNTYRANRPHENLP